MKEKNTRLQHPKYWEIIGLVIGGLALIVAIFQLNQGEDKVHNGIPKKDDKIEESKNRESSSIVTVFESEFQHIDFADTDLSVAFQNMNGEEYVSLYVKPTGQKSRVYAVVDGSAVEFKSSNASYSIQVMRIDYSKKEITLKVNKMGSRQL